MTNQCFEIAFRDVVNAPTWRDELARFFAVPVGNIVDLNDYWDLERVCQEACIGVTADYSDSGLRTLLRGVWSFPMDGEPMGALAFHLARRLKTEVVIGDYAYPDPLAQDRSLVFFPDGSCARCTGSWDSARAVNDIEVVPFGRPPE